MERTSDGIAWRTEATHDTIYEPPEAGRNIEFLPYMFGKSDNLELLAKHGYPMKGRVLSDHESGRSDTVAVEWEVDSMADYEGALEGLMSNAEAAREFGSWEEQLGEMIHYSVAEQWTLR